MEVGAFATPRKLRDPLLIGIMASSTLHENTTQIVEVNHVTNFVMGFFLHHFVILLQRLSIVHIHQFVAPGPN